MIKAKFIPSIVYMRLWQDKWGNLDRPHRHHKKSVQVLLHDARQACGVRFMDGYYACITTL